MNLCYGVGLRMLDLRSTTRYLPEQVEALARRHAGQPMFLLVENERVPIPEGCLPFAASLAASFHNQVCYNLPPEDGSVEETLAMEQAAQAHMEAPDSDHDDEWGDEG